MKINIIIPTHNEEIVIEKNLRQLLEFYKQALLQDDWQIIVANNASSDQTRTIVSELACHEPRLILWTTETKGKGNALRQVLTRFPADVSVFMDADLATDLQDIPLLFSALQENDLVIGSRFVKGAKVERGLLRALISHSYSWLAQFIFKSQIKDFQCGFKAMNRRIVEDVVSKTEDIGWLFDTELVVLAERSGYKVLEIPIHWVETRDKRRKSSVKFFRTIVDHGRQIFSLWKRLKMNNKKF